jgi:predicted DNA-binding transcriptional regulator AlpA
MAARHFFASHDEPYISANEAARYLGLSIPALHSLLYRRRQAGKPIPVKRLGKSLKFRKSELDAALSREGVAV